jgi:ABC-type lipoprotein release transport system permease subunit
VGWSYVFLAVAVVIVAAAWPAWRTSRLQVVEALRAE